jgi:hypothetical protein
MTIKGSILRLIEKNYDGKLRTIVIIKIGTYVNKNQNNELAIFFNENKLHLLNDFGVDDTVIVECTTLCFTNDNHRFYNYILGQSIKFDVIHYPFYRKKYMGKKMEMQKNKVVFDADFEYENMILQGWTNAGLIEAGYVKRKPVESKLENNGKENI